MERNGRGLQARADNVYDLAEWRAYRRPEPLPPAVLHDIEVAGRVYDALFALGHEVRLDVPADGGRVRAELRTLDGELVRPVPLVELVDVAGPLPDPAA